MVVTMLSIFCVKSLISFCATNRPVLPTAMSVCGVAAETVFIDSGSARQHAPSLDAGEVLAQSRRSQTSTRAKRLVDFCRLKRAKFSLYCRCGLPSTLPSFSKQLNQLEDEAVAFLACVRAPRACRGRCCVST